MTALKSIVTASLDGAVRTLCKVYVSDRVTLLPVRTNAEGFERQREKKYLQ